MTQHEIAMFKLDIFRTIMGAGMTDSATAADQAERIYEKFYLGKQDITTTKPAKKR